MNLLWVTALRDHGQGYQWLLDDLALLRDVYQQDLNRTNPEKPYTVAANQAKIAAIEDLLFVIKTEERKETNHAERTSTLERRAAAAKPRFVKSA